MPVLVPEKTIELWTAAAVLEQVSEALIWSPVQTLESSDQWIRHAGKIWAFELKAASAGRIPGIRLEWAQLVAHVAQPDGVSVLYVLPAVPWAVAPPAVPVPTEAGRRADFCDWAYVVPARELQATVAARRRRGAASYRLPLADVPAVGVTLRRFLGDVVACDEPEDWGLRRYEDADARVHGDELIDVRTTRFYVWVPESALAAQLRQPSRPPMNSSAD